MAAERTPSKYHMTAGEAEDFLRSLNRTGSIVQVDASHLHMKPTEIVNAVHLRAGLPPLSSELPELRQQQSQLATAARQAAAHHDAKLHRAVVKRKKFWALTAMLSGTQMTVLAYLQFQVFGWDIMEPITYFVTTITALCTYMYFLRYRTEHSYGSVDEKVTSHLLAQDMRCSVEDVAQWVNDAQMSKEVTEALSGSIDEAAQYLSTDDGNNSSDSRESRKE